jgi:uncharacterized membrane protein YbhN (UPF0104 family)
VSASIWKGLFKYGLAVALLAYVVARNWQPDDGAGPGLAEALARPVQVLPLALAAGLAVAGLLITFVRWWGLVRAQGLPFRLTDAVRLGMVGYFFNTFLPGAVGGDIVKAVALARGQSRRTVAVATVLFDRAVGLWGLVWLVALAGGAFWLAGEPLLLGNTRLLAIVRSAVAIVAVTAGGWLLLGLLPERRAHRLAGRLALTPKVGHALAELWRAVWLYRRRPRAVAVALGLTLVNHTANVLLFHCAARTFVPAAEAAQLPSLAEDVLVVPVGLAVQAGFPTPGGAGAGEAAFGWLYHDVLGRSAALGVLASLAQRVLSWVLGLAGYIAYLRTRPALSGPGPEAVPAPATAGAAGP